MVYTLRCKLILKFLVTINKHIIKNLDFWITVTNQKLKIIYNNMRNYDNFLIILRRWYLKLLEYFMDSICIAQRETVGLVCLQDCRGTASV